ncbi:hypothetical protein G6F57_009928 [Rhizopus arrhizus]|uniref:2-dehydropantoate 2-reductase n=1 Tax=Rhizopus oryzae TaxID=64495 RepID=A0A9P6X761_RHIOR|nr:hypothetical protein G6F23_009004 [Rhizopus arrhizus]KAG1413420.1 hypothetical protein G6F58_007501 [Rhizopus delemar]KAG0762007.1 hypothetical protein G6F24_007134 [Rhizopus arrhizus]KAG0784511.1 hypothetical protein G6F21_009858 [Rhizopus arrhizus]KAG0789241.1 hypothetical protein G6F22_006771 [Rhizopus arrhizus]
MNVHILGTGAIGCHIASVLKRNNHNVTLLLRSKSHLEDFRNRGNTITYRWQGKTEYISGFEANVVKEQTNPITSLVLATKAPHTLNAFSSVAPYLSTSSTVLLLQNGMGSADELIKSHWSKTKSSSVLVGVNRHAIERLAPYDICHHSGYLTDESLVIGQHPASSATSNNKLAEVIAGIPEFRAKYLPWEQVYMRMLKKLFINASINSVATVLGSRNKCVLNPYGETLLRAICEETYEVFKDDLPGEDFKSIMKMVSDIAIEARENTCSTLQDIQNGRLTEVDYINGYICKVGKERNINTTTNQNMVNLIHAKEILCGLDK